MARQDDIRGLEDKARSEGYDIKVKVDAAGDTLVTLTSVRYKHVFEGKASARVGNAYAVALETAVVRMRAFEERFVK